MGQENDTGGLDEKLRRFSDALDVEVAELTEDIDKLRHLALANHNNFAFQSWVRRSLRSYDEDEPRPITVTMTSPRGRIAGITRAYIRHRYTTIRHPDYGELSYDELSDLLYERGSRWSTYIYPRLRERVDRAIHNALVKRGEDYFAYSSPAEHEEMHCHRDDGGSIVIRKKKVRHKRSTVVSREWKNEFQFYHRLLGPAVERSDGTKGWWLNGLRHREDGPAKIKADGSTEWWLNGKQHREDGPAIETAKGNREWWLNGKQHRIGGPAIETHKGHREWRMQSKLHREDGPSIERADGTKEWYLHGKRHREDGPAIERASGEKGWWLDGEELSEAEWKIRVAKD